MRAKCLVRFGWVDGECGNGFFVKDMAGTSC